MFRWNHIPILLASHLMTLNSLVVLSSSTLA